MYANQNTLNRGGRSTRDVSDLTGATYRQVDYWARQGWLTPSVEECRGSGTARRWSDQDVQDVRLLLALVTRVIPDAIPEAVTKARDARGPYLWVEGGLVETGSFLDLHDALSGALDGVVVVNLNNLG